MKKSLWVMILICSCHLLYAQKTRFNFGAGAGVNFANISFKNGNHYFDLDPKLGFAGYVFLDLPVIHQFSLQNEIGYYNLGTFANNEKNAVNWRNETTSINYLTISILPKISVRNTGLSFLLGPSLGYKLSSKTTGGGLIVPDQSGGGTYITDIFTPVDIFGIASVEYYLNMGLGISVRYLRGLTNIYDGSYGTPATIYNRAFIFTVNYRLFR